jgi:hypothetical protein
MTATRFDRVKMVGAWALGAAMLTGVVHVLSVSFRHFVLQNFIWVSGPETISSEGRPPMPKVSGTTSQNLAAAPASPTAVSRAASTILIPINLQQTNVARAHRVAISETTARTAPSHVTPNTA